MKPTIPIRKALTDKKLLGSVLAGDSWRSWRALMIAAMGEPLTADERLIFTRLTGRSAEPLQPVEELAAVVGRRGGKSRAMSVLAVYVAALCKHSLVRGERGVVLLIAPDQRQAAIALDYAEAALEQSLILKQLIANRTADTLELTNGINIEVRAASFRRLRGPTYIAVIADEAAFWMSDEFSSNADTEILNAVRPGLATTGGPLIIASSPYAKRGVLWDTFRRHYGKDGDPLILVAQGSSATSIRHCRSRSSTEHWSVTMPQPQPSTSLSFAPILRRSSLMRSCRHASAITSEMAPLGQHQYVGFIDPSGGSADSFTMAVAHRDGERLVVDATREVRPPFSPEAVIDDFAILLKTYRVHKVTGDRYAGEFPRELFRKRGITYQCSEKPKSDLFRDFCRC